MGDKEKIPRDVPETDPAEWLRAEYDERRARNPRYSLRAFARFLAIPSGPLSEILSLKRPLTQRQASHIADRLGYSEGERALFLQSLRRHRQQRGEPVSNLPFHALTEDVFRVVANWYHYALRELVGTRDFRPDPQWMARRLGVSPQEAQVAWGRLTRLGMILKSGERWISAGGVTTTHDIPSRALRKFHRQTLHKAISALEEVPVAERDITSITIAVDVSRLEEAKGRIRQFRRSLAEFLETGAPTEVYQLSIQLIPLTQKETENA